MVRNFYKPNNLSRLHKQKAKVTIISYEEKLHSKSDVDAIRNPDVILAWQIIARSLFASPQAEVIWSITPHGAPTM